MKYLMKNLMIFLTIVTMTNSEVLFAQEKICFPKETAKKMRLDLLKKDFLEVENGSLKRSLDLSTKALQLRKEQLDTSQMNNDRLAERLRKTSESNDWQKGMWFFFGVLATGAAVYGAGRLK